MAPGASWRFAGEAEPIWSTWLAAPSRAAKRCDRLFRRLVNHVEPEEVLLGDRIWPPDWASIFSRSS